MNVYPLKNDQGQTFGLQIDVPLRGRRRVCAIVSKLKGVRITRRPLAFSWLREENFCEFILGDVTFSIEEPFGDNSRYWIGPSDGNIHPELKAIVTAFEDAGRW